MDQLVYLNIPNLNDVIGLRLELNYIFPQLSANCLNLKALSIGVFINTLDKLKNFLTEVKKFKALRRLSFYICLDFDLKLEEYFKDCSL